MRMTAVMLVVLVVVGLAPPAPAQVDEPAVAAGRSGVLLASEADRLLDERELRPVIYNGVNFLVLAAQGKMNQADGIFLTRGRARQALQEGRTLDALRQLDLKPPFAVQCVGFNPISLDAITVVYVGTTESGPVGVKLYLYKYRGGTYVGRVDVAEEWGELERMTDSVLRLPAPLVINVTAGKGDGGDVPAGGDAPAPAPAK